MVARTCRRSARPIRDDQAVVPSLWCFELRDTLIINERRRRRITEADTSSFRCQLARLNMTTDRSPEEPEDCCG